MLLSSLSLFLLAPISALAQQIVLDQLHNATAISGTWSSGSMNVITGPNFANPVKGTFTYPNTTGVSFSFLENAPGSGFFETSRYRMNGNGSSPNCITGVMLWMHGTFTLNSNGSITLNPFGDGYQQIQSVCAATSDFVETYNDTELYMSWQIIVDATLGPQLTMYQSNGIPFPPQSLYAQAPLMLPTQPLRNDSSTNSKVSRRAVTNDAPPIPRWDVAIVAAVGGLLGSAVLVLA